jgi:hypothetical protein
MTDHPKWAEYLGVAEATDGAAAPISDTEPRSGRPGVIAQAMIEAASTVCCGLEIFDGRHADFWSPWPMSWPLTPPHAFGGRRWPGTPDFDFEL